MNKANRLTPRPLLTTVGAAAALLAMGCSNAIQSGSTCARTQSTGSDSAAGRSLEDDRKLLMKVGLPRNTPGGYIDVDYWADKATGKAVVNWEAAQTAQTAVKKTRRCTAVVTLDKGDATTAMRIWTADHCIQPASDVALRVHLYGAGGYAAFPVRTDVFDVVTRARADSASLPATAREFFLSACNALATQSAGARYQTGDLKANYSQACFSMADLSTFRVTLAQSAADFDANQRAVWTESQELQKKLRAYYDLFKSDLLSSIGEDVFAGSFRELMNVRRLEAITAFTQKLDAGKCAVLDTLPPCPADVHTQMRKLHERYFSKNRFEDGDLAALATKLRTEPFSTTVASFLTGGGLSQALAAIFIRLTRASDDGRSSYQALSELVWGVIKAGAQGTSLFASANKTWSQASGADLDNVNHRFQYSFQSNIHSSGTPTEVKWRWLSTLRSIADAGKGDKDGAFVQLNLHEGSDAIKRVLVLSSHREKAPFRFEKGDSGSAVGVFVFPFGTLSTVDWEETEGVPVTLLPPAGTYKEDGAVASGGSAEGAPGQNAGGPKAPNKGGDEVASSGEAGKQGAGGKASCVN